MSAALLLPIDRLRHARDFLRRGNHPDLAAVADGLDRYLDIHSNETLDQALGLLPAPGAEHWRTVARRQVRDAEFCMLAALYLPDTKTAPRVRKIVALGSKFAIRWQRVDQHLAAMPASYRGTPDEHLFRAFVAGGGKMPSARSLRRMLCRIGHQPPPVDGQESG
jgi:hypothetical protein